jgi:hypothetical protein
MQTRHTTYRARKDVVNRGGYDCRPGQEGVRWEAESAGLGKMLKMGLLEACEAARKRRVARAVIYARPREKSAARGFKAFLS